GYGAAEMVGLRTPAVIHLPSEMEARGAELTAELGRPVQGFDVFVEEARRGGHDEREWTYVRKDGTHLTVSLVVTAVRDPSGAITGFLGIAKDMTARKQTEEALLRYAQDAEAARSRIENQAAELVRQAEELRAAQMRAEAASEAKSAFLA